MNCPHCGCEIEKQGKSRSIDQHRRYFAIIRNTYANWPESHDVQFATETECRKWLQMKAGYRELALRMPVTGIKPDHAALIAATAMRAAGAHAVAVAHKGELCVWKPISIAFQKMGPAEFGKLCDDVSAVIEAETGMKADELLKERAA